jgi:hypothetical protein
MALFDERAFNHQRYLTLLASKPIGKQGHGRVWSVRGDAFMVNGDGRILTVTSIAGWLQDAGLLKQGTPRATGGYYLVPTGDGFVRLDERLRGAAHVS